MDPESSMPQAQAAVVIGSGPAGPATAAELLRRRVATTVLERSDQLGAAWAGRYDSLRFNTGRRHSALPGAPFPRSWGQFPTRDQYVRYLHGYAAAHRVQSAPVGGGPPGRRTWRLGVDHRLWTGPRAGRGGGMRRPEPLAGRSVLVVGTGSTGMELAHEPAGAGARVWLSFHSPPNILMREMHDIPGDLPVPLMLRLPTPLVAQMVLTMQHCVVGDLAPQRSARAGEGTDDPVEDTRRLKRGSGGPSSGGLDPLRYGPGGRGCGQS